MNTRIFLANVGANRSHPFASPIYADGSFELVPITETPGEPGPHSVRFQDLSCLQDPSRSLSDLMPSRMAELAAHYDPEWETLTYGDNCERAARARGLRSACRGDLLFFLARLCRHDGERFTGAAGFYLVGFLEIESILRAAYTPPPPDLLERVRANAHVRRAMNDPAWWDGFWVFAGSSRSRRFDPAVPVDREFAQRAFLAADGSPWQWGGGRSELQTIGSYTRTCRAVVAPGQPRASDRAAALFERVERYNPGVMPSDARGVRLK